MNLFICTPPAYNNNYNIFKLTVVRKKIVVQNAEVTGPLTMNAMYLQKVWH